MNQFSGTRQFNKEAKVQFILMIFFLITLVLLSACGKSQNNGDTNLSDREAPYLVSGKINSSTEEVLAEEDEQDASTGESNQEKQQQRLQYLRNLHVEANFDSQEKPVEVVADVQLPNGSYLPVRLKGQFKRDNTGEGTSHFATLTDPNVPFLIAKAQCINDCDHIVLHTIVRESETQFVTNQYRTLNERVDTNTNPKLSEQTKVASDKEGTDDKKDEDTISGASPQQPQSEQEASADDNINAGKIGAFAKAQVSYSEIASLLPRAQFTTRTEIERPSAKIPENKDESPSVVLRPSVPDLKAEELQEELAKMEIQGTGVVVTESAADTDYPFNLGPKYSGQAEGCYSGLKRKYANGKVFVCATGKLSLANLVESTLFGSITDVEDKYRYTNGLMYKFLERVAETMKNTLNTNLKIGGIALQYGGLFPPHKSHQNGLDADIPLPKKETGALDIEKTWEMLKVMYSQQYRENNESIPLVQLFILNPSRKNDICKVAKAKKEQEHPALNRIYYKNSNGTVIKNHDTHVHVRLECTSHNSCQEFKTPPAKKSPCI